MRLVRFRSMICLEMVTWRARVLLGLLALAWLLEILRQWVTIT